MTADSKTVSPSARTSAGTFCSGLTAANSRLFSSGYVTTRRSTAGPMPSLSASHSRIRAALFECFMSKNVGRAEAALAAREAARREEAAPARSEAAPARELAAKSAELAERAANVSMAPDNFLVLIGKIRRGAAADRGFKANGRFK